MMNLVQSRLADMLRPMSYLLLVLGGLLGAIGIVPCHTVLASTSEGSLNLPTQPELVESVTASVDDDGYTEIVVELGFVPDELGCQQFAVWLDSSPKSYAQSSNGSPSSVSAIADSHQTAQYVLRLTPIPLHMANLQFGLSCLRSPRLPPIQIETFFRIIAWDDEGLPTLFPLPVNSVDLADPEPQPAVLVGPSDTTGLTLNAQTCESSKTLRDQPLLVFLGNWKYFEERIQCEESGGSSGAKFPCSAKNTYRALKGAQVDIYRRRGGVDTLILTGWTSPTLSSGGFLFGLYDDYESTDQFWMVMSLKYIGRQNITSSYLWKLKHNGLYTPQVFSGPVTGTDLGSIVMIDFGTNAIQAQTIYAHDANIYASICEAFELCLSSDTCVDREDLCPMHVDAYEVTDIANCPNGSIASGNYYRVRLCSTPNASTWAKNFTHAHEFGHHIAARLLYPGNVQDFYWSPPDQSPPPGAMHNWTSQAWEEGALHEGWAGFFSGATMFEPHASDPYTIGGNQLHSLSDPPDLNGPICVQCVDGWQNPAALSSCEGNPARFFWDIYDSVNDDWFGDSMQVDIGEVIDIWEYFPYCSSNHCSDEMDGPNWADNGPNAYDIRYWMVMYGYSAVYIDETIYGNCLNGSDIN